MKRIFPALFILCTTLALAQTAQAPTLENYARIFDDHASIATNWAALTVEYPALHYYFLGRADAFNAAAELLRTQRRIEP